MYKLTQLNIRWVVILALVGGLLCVPAVMAEEKETPPDLLEPDAVWDPVQEIWLNPEEAIEAEEEAASAGSRDDQELIGEPFEDWVYTAVNPCIIVDTRDAGGPIAESFTEALMSMAIWGARVVLTALCHPEKPAPRAVHINLIAIPVSGGNGNIRAYPNGAPTSDGLSVNFNSVFPVNLANAGTVKINTGGGTDIRVMANDATSNVKIEVLGYYFDSQSVVGGDAPISCRGWCCLSATDTSVQDVSMTILVHGEVLLIGNGTFRLPTQQLQMGLVARLNWEPPSHQQCCCMYEYGGNYLDYCPITVTRSFGVSPGTITFRLVCDQQSGIVSMQRARIHAIFYQTRY